MASSSLVNLLDVRVPQPFGHAGAIAFSRTTDFEIGKFDAKHILRRFEQVPSEY
jgi:hypothetical protein